MKGAGIIFWKKESNKIYVLLAKRAHGYGKNYYSTFGGHKEKVDFEDGKLNLFNTAIRESAEETGIIKDHGSKVELEKAKQFFSKDGFKLNPKPIRKVNVPYYQFYTYECEVTDSSKWYKESWEHYYGTMDWYALDSLPKPLLFAAKLNILQIRCKV